MAIDTYELEVTGSTTAYLKLPTHPGNLKNARSVPLSSVMGPYKGPYIVFDFDSQGVLVGIEIIADDPNDTEVT